MAKTTLSMDKGTESLPLPALVIYAEKPSSTLDMNGQPKTFSIGHASAEVAEVETIETKDGRTVKIPTGNIYKLNVSLYRVNPVCDRDHIAPKVKKEKAA